MDTYYDPQNDVDRDIHNSQSSESSNSSGTSHESREERAARIRQNQRRCRERKLAYVASLEERLRAYETNGVQANIHLQKLAKKLDVENRKLKKVLFESCGIGDGEIERSDTDSLIEEIKARMSSGSGTTTPRPKRITASRSSSFSGGIIGTSSTAWSSYASTCTPFQGCCPTAPLSDIRSQKPPTPPPNKDDISTAGDLLLTLAPRTAVSCGEGLTPSGKRFCGLLQLLASESSGTGDDSGKSVPCRVSYELLKNLIDEQDSLSMENAAFVLKDGVRLEENGCQVDATMLTKVLERLTNVDNNNTSEGMLVDV